MNDEVFYRRAFTLVTVGVLAWLLFSTLRPLFTPIAWALFLAFLLHAPNRWVVRRTGGRRALSAAMLTIATVLLIVGPLTALVAAFTSQAADLLRSLQSFAAGHRPTEPYDLASIPVVGPAALWIQDQTGISLPQMQGWLLEAARNLLRIVAGFGGGAVLGALDTVVRFVLMIFILFFAIRDGEEWAQTGRRLVPMKSEDRRALIAHLAAVTRAMVYGTGITALIQGTMIGAGFAAVGLPSPIVFGVLATLFAMVPLAGTPVVWIPAVIVLALQGRTTAAIVLLAWGGVVVTIDNVIRPLLVSGRAEVGSLTVFVGVIGGVAAFGPIGLLLGPLVIAAATAILQFAMERRPRESEADASG